MRTLIVGVALVACNGDEPGKPPETGAETETGGDTGTPPALAISGVSTSVHPTIGSIVVVGWDQSADAQVHLEFSVDPGEWRSSPVRELAAGPHEEWLLGVPYDTDVTWRLVADGPSGSVTTDDAVDHSGPTPDDLPEISLLAADPAAYDPSTPWVVVSYTYGVDWTEVIDRKGRRVWVMPPPTDRATMYPHVSLAGDSFLIDHNSLWGVFDGGAASEVVEVKIDGSVVRTWATPGLHHPFVELPGGSIAYARQHDGYLEDVTAVAPDGSTTTLWDCDAWLAEVLPQGVCSANALTRDPVTEHLLVTEYTLATTIEFDPATGEAVRWFGAGDPYFGVVPGSYAFDPPESQTVYPHGVTLTEAGTLLMSDSAGPIPAPMVVREFAIDDATATLTPVFTFGAEQPVVGSYGFGDVFRTPNGNTQQNTAMGRLREVTPAGEVVWDVEWMGAYTPPMYRSEPFADLYALAPARQ